MVVGNVGVGAVIKEELGDIVVIFQHRHRHWRDAFRIYDVGRGAALEQQLNDVIPTIGRGIMQRRIARQVNVIRICSLKVGFKSAFFTNRYTFEIVLKERSLPC